MTEGMELTNQDKIRTLGEKETYKYLGILKADTIIQVDTKEKNQKCVSQGNEKATRNQTIWQDLIKVINTWAVSFVSYSRLFLKWAKEELNEIDQTRKLMTMHMAWHLRDNVDRFYVSRKEGGRGFASIEDHFNVSIQRLEDNIEKSGGKLITATSNNSDNAWINRMEITRKQKLKEK